MRRLESVAAKRRMTVAEMIVETIERVGGVEPAAKEIGVSKPIVWNWLREHGYSVVTGRWAKVHFPAQSDDVTVASALPEPRYEPLDE